MGYRIVYGQDSLRDRRPGDRLRILTASFALAFVILVQLFYPQGVQTLRQWLLPGESEAFMKLTEEIRAGEPIGDAVTAFCQNVMEEAIGEAG